MRLLREEDMEDFQEEVGVVWDHSKCHLFFLVFRLVTCFWLVSKDDNNRGGWGSWFPLCSWLFFFLVWGLKTKVCRYKKDVRQILNGSRDV